MSFQPSDDQLIVEGGLAKQGNSVHATVPLSIRRRWARAMKMDAGELFRLKVVWHYKNGQITARLENPDA